MKLPIGVGTAGPAIAPPRGPRVLGMTCASLALLSVAAWTLPEPKPGAVLGRLSYFQFWAAVTLTAGTLSTLLLAMLPAARRRVAAFRTGAVWLGTALALLAAELAAWWLPVRHQMDNPWYVAAGGGLSGSADLPFERPAHLKWHGRSRGDLALLNGDDDPCSRSVTFRTDREGFHNDKDIRQADLIMIGDSFTEAGNVPEAESFPTLVGGKLGVTVRNLGRAGYTSPTELIVLKKYGLKCRPKIVIWQIAESNDLAEALGYQSWVANGRPRYFDQTKKGRSSRQESWRQRSPTCRVFSLLRTRHFQPWPLAGTFHASDGTEYPVRFFPSPALTEPALGNPGWNIFARALADGAALCRSQDIQLLVVMIPMKFRVLGPYTKLSAQTEAAMSRFAGLPDEVALGAQLQQFCAARGIPFLDATQRLKSEAAKGALVYLPFDTHLSPLGHQVVADLIAGELASVEHQTYVLHNP